MTKGCLTGPDRRGFSHPLRLRVILQKWALPHLNLISLVWVGKGKNSLKTIFIAVVLFIGEEAETENRGVGR